MKIRRKAFLIVFLGLVFFTCGCAWYYPESEQTFEVGSQLMDNNTRMLSITSDSHYFAAKQEDILPKLNATVNSGKYNIIYVKTFYSVEYLTAAEIAYNASGRGEGNNIRLMIIQSDEHFWERMAPIIRSRLEEVVNSHRYNILKVNMVYVEGNLVVAEVYTRGSN